MSEVWKYQVNEDQKITMPAGAKILNVFGQNDKVCMWVQVDPSAETEGREFKVYGTGINIADSDNERYAGTAHIFGGRLVFHVFEKIGGCD